MNIGKNEINKLKMLIYVNLLNEFSEHYITQNLVNTISFEVSNEGISIDIPAEIYDLALWKEKGVLIYTGKGSYASKVDTSGGYSKTHKDFVVKAIEKSLSEWMRIYNFKGRIDKQ